ncbi:MAG: hypothetical protein JW729_06650 [Bacteroidales bacterium]|nr:hypothetical protein [Bacteroidales bacterium]
MEKDLDAILGGISKTGGLKKPDASYFEDFAAKLPLTDSSKSKKILFSSRTIWYSVASYAAVALILMLVGFFVYDSQVSKSTDFSISMDELMALNDFDNYNEELIYSELAMMEDFDQTSEAELDAMMQVDGLSTDEIMDAFSTTDLNK